MQKAEGRAKSSESAQGSGPPMGTGGRKDLHQQGAAGPRRRLAGRAGLFQHSCLGHFQGHTPPTSCHPLSDAHPKVVVKKKQVQNGHVTWSFWPVRRAVLFVMVLGQSLGFECWPYSEHQVRL